MGYNTKRQYWTTTFYEVKKTGWSPNFMIFQPLSKLQNPIQVYTNIAFYINPRLLEGVPFVFIILYPYNHKSSRKGTYIPSIDILIKLIYMASSTEVIVIKMVLNLALHSYNTFGLGLMQQNQRCCLFYSLSKAGAYITHNTTQPPIVWLGYLDV